MTRGSTFESRVWPGWSALLDPLAGVWPGGVGGDETLERSLLFLGVDCSSTTVVAAARVVGVTVACLGWVVGIALAGPSTAMAGVAVGTSLALVGPKVPVFAARIRRTRALGAAPSLVTRLAVAMRVAGAPERAVDHAASDDRGALAASLAGHRRLARGRPGSGLTTFGDEWAAWFPALQRATSLVASAGATPAADRSAPLDRARTVVLDAARDRMASFASSIKGPATALYAFGVLVPLALVSLLPALGAAGVRVPVGLVVLVYDCLLPIAVATAGGWLLSRRPVAFPPPSIDRTHPAVWAKRWPPIVAGGCGAAVGWVLATSVLPAWTGPLAAVGCGAGVALVVGFHSHNVARSEIREVEAGLSDVLRLLGRRVARGEAVESALPDVAERVDGATGRVFADAAARQRCLGVDVERALTGAGGSPALVASARADDVAAMIALASVEGPPAGEALVAMGSHLDELATVEREARRNVEQVSRTLQNTAAIFGPLVGGSTVALSATIGTAGPLATSSLPVEVLGPVVGLYVLVLAALLTAIATGLSRGLDRVLIGYRVGQSLLAGTATYLTAIYATGLLV